MNKTESKFNLKTFLMLFMTIMLTLVMAFATACNKNSSESTSDSESESASESEEAKADTQTLLNGDFEFTSSKSFPATPRSWSFTTDGSPFTPSTSLSKGMIDTADEAWDKLSSTHKATVNPKTPITEDDADTEANEAGTQILMLHAKDSFSAQYYTSSTTLSVPAGQYGVFSVWVNTAEVESNNGKAGAYIKIKNNVVKADNETYDPLLIENIDTEGKWVKYTIYVAPNNVKATSYTLILGFGQGNKFLTEKLVKGFAFFDNATFDYLSSSEYANITADVTKDVNSDFVVDESAVDFTTTTARTVSLSLVETTPNVLPIGDVIDTANSGYNNVNINNVENGFAVNNVGDKVGIATESNKKTVQGEELSNAIFMDFTGLKIGSSYTFTTQTQQVGSKQYARISFWAKVVAPDYATKATVELYDVIKGEAVASFENFNTEGYENEYTNDYARYTFYVANNFPEKDGEGNVIANKEYSIKFSFGPTDKNTVTDIKTLPVGYAIFKDFEVEVFTDKDSFDLVDTTTDTRAKKAALIGDYLTDWVDDEEDEESEKNDSYSITLNSNANLMLKEGEIIGLNDVSSVNLSTNAGETDKVGVINSKYASSYAANVQTALSYLTSDSVKPTNGNKNVQVILVQSGNTNGVYVAGNSVTIAANTTYTFSTYVYVDANSTAYAEIINMGDSVSAKEVMSYKINDKTYTMATEITNADCTSLNGFAKVTFIITAGKDALNVRFEFGVKGKGFAFFDSISTGASSTAYTNADAVEEAFNGGIDYNFTTVEEYDQDKIYYYADEADVGDEDLRLKDENGEFRFDIGTKDTVVFFGKANKSNASANLIQYYRYDTLNPYRIDATANDGADKDTSEDESTEESSPATTEPQKFAWLQVTSIIIALVLIGALIAIVLRQFFAKRTKKKAKTKKYYHQGYNKNNRYSKSTSDVAVPDDEDNSKAYDYDDNGDEDASSDEE